MSRHDLTTIRCTAKRGFAESCTAYVRAEMIHNGLYLCQEHLIYAWSLIQEQIKAGASVNRKKDLVPGVKALDGYEGWVYYLKVGDRIKIGHSLDPSRRLASYPPGSDLIAIRRGSRKTERAEHVRYDVHLADGREWFQYSNELVADILREDDTRSENEAESVLFMEGNRSRIKADDTRSAVRYRRKSTC